MIALALATWDRGERNACLVTLHDARITDSSHLCWMDYLCFNEQLRPGDEARGDVGGARDSAVHFIGTEPVSAYSELGASKLKFGQHCWFESSCGHAALSGEDPWGCAVPIGAQLRSWTVLDSHTKKRILLLSDIVSTLPCYGCIVVSGDLTFLLR